MRSSAVQRTRRLPGDDLVPAPMWQSTRSLSIDAPRERVWPWVVQMGFPTFRAGWYTPYTLDRLMWHIEAHSADRIVDELQDLAVGDRVPDSPDFSVFFTVAEVDPGHALVLFSTRHVLAPYDDVRFSWAFVLEDDGSEERCRATIRARVTYRPVWPAWAARLFVSGVMGPGDFVNASWMLRGIRQRAENRPALTPAALALRTAHAGISVAFLSAIGYVWWCGLTRRRGPLLRAAVTALGCEGVAVAANGGDCPLGGLQDRVGDPVPLFELVLSPRAAKLAVPVLGAIAALGIALVAAHPPQRARSCRL